MDAPTERAYSSARTKLTLTRLSTLPPPTERMFEEAKLRRMARLARVPYVGIDPEEEAIATARSTTPPELAQRVRFEVGAAEDLSRTAVYDVAFLSWSL